MSSEKIPSLQRAVQLVGPDQLALNDKKPVEAPRPHQILGRVEVTGLCFSDLKLLKQFEQHVRKSEVIAGLDAATLKEIPSYVPGSRPAVPGHETVVRVVAVGDKVRSVKPGDRRLVQADYRWLKTADSNAAFGYNFEGALQEYVLMDERAITSPEGESMLLPASAGLSASAIALVEPWACVENSYVSRERSAPKPGGRMLDVRAGSFDAGVLDRIPNESIDDLIFHGADADLLEKLFPKIARNGLVNIAQNGAVFGRPVITPVGRLHYGGVRITGTTGPDPAAGYAAIPATGEIRESDVINVVGAAGPMGTMHVIRNLCQGVRGVSVLGGDMNDDRLAQLDQLAAPVARAAGTTFRAYNAKTNPPPGPFGYIALMVPAPALVADAVRQAAPKAVINIFAGIPATVLHPIDLDAYLSKRAYFIGTSGSVLEDMKIVLRKVESRQLDTNLSVAAVSGLDGAIDGIRAVEKQLVPGKILVYPSCKGLKLTALGELASTHPRVAARLKDGAWTAEAEKALLDDYASRA
jgi:threonine dehydrogenase-like Zn-dependent dehydrogenase